MKYILITMSFVCIGFSAYLGLKSQQFEMVAFLVTAGMLLLFAHLPYISKGKVGTRGIEIETREVLKNARDTIDELKELATQVATVTLSLVQRSGRLSGFTGQQKEEIKNNTLQILRKIGLEEDEIYDTLKGWHQVIESDYAHWLLDKFVSLKSDSVEGKRQLEKLKRYGNYSKRPSPEELTKFIKEFGTITDEGREWIDDYRYYAKNREHRRPEVWTSVFK